MKSVIEPARRWLAGLSEDPDVLSTDYRKCAAKPGGLTPEDGYMQFRNVQGPWTKSIKGFDQPMNIYKWRAPRRRSIHVSVSDKAKPTKLAMRIAMHYHLQMSFYEKRRGR